MPNETRIPSGSKIPGIPLSVEILEIGKQGQPGELIIHNGKIYVYGPNGETLIDGGIIQTEAFLANSITAEKLTIGGQFFTHTIVWTATDENTASWSSGTINWGDGTTSAISSGNTGNIAATSFIYYDETSTLKVTTDSAVAIGDTKKLLAIVEIGQTGGKCIITPIFSVGTTIDANKIVTGIITSVDGKTYFDLSGKRIVMSDTSNSRLLLGFHEGGF